MCILAASSASRCFVITSVRLGTEFSVTILVDPVHVPPLQSAGNDCVCCAANRRLSSETLTKAICDKAATLCCAAVLTRAQHSDDTVNKKATNGKVVAAKKNADCSPSRISETVQSLALKIDLRKLWLAQNGVTYLYKKKTMSAQRSPR